MIVVIIILFKILRAYSAFDKLCLQQTGRQIHLGLVIELANLANRDWRELLTLEGHRNVVYAIAFNVP